ncbi:hypothetical protein A9Q95_15415 [Rhodobacterales bacterium 59_46_T64]|nr:hypothetical protein A9Q95_15415 [Rhodobacterales bacterium 59_46_T64]
MRGHASVFTATDKPRGGLQGRKTTVRRKDRSGVLFCVDYDAEQKKLNEAGVRETRDTSPKAIVQTIPYGTGSTRAPRARKRLTCPQLTHFARTNGNGTNGRASRLRL